MTFIINCVSSCKKKCLYGIQGNKALLPSWMPYRFSLWVISFSVHHRKFGQDLITTVTTPGLNSALPSLNAIGLWMHNYHNIIHSVSPPTTNCWVGEWSRWLGCIMAWLMKSLCVWRPPTRSFTETVFSFVWVHQDHSDMVIIPSLKWSFIRNV